MIFNYIPLIMLQQGMGMCYTAHRQEQQQLLIKRGWGHNLDQNYFKKDKCRTLEAGDPGLTQSPCENMEAI